MSKKLMYLLLPLILIVWSCSEDDDTIIIEDNNTEEVIDLTITGEILKLVNEHRETLGLSSLKRNNTADELCNDHTQYMIYQGKISHDYFENRWTVLREVENARSAGENVASGYQDAKSVMNAWLNSTGHKENIEGNFTHIGIAAKKDSQNRYYFTQSFYK
ncbi:MAG: CAP domain-containing protein [Flavobacteriaceae bacterium]|nr:CAP domain-containing protein [Flavobacteriaceae bacterium]